jgi:hypothetical protein
LRITEVKKVVYFKFYNDSMKWLIVLFLFAYCFLEAKAQSQKDSLEIMQSIHNFFLGMKTKDTILLKAHIYPSTKYFQTFEKDKKGLTKIDSTPVRLFIASIGNDQSNSFDERIFNPVVKIDDVLATVWVDYEFWYNGKKTHTGVDAFTMLHVNNKWLITAITDTRKKSLSN